MAENDDVAGSQSGESFPKTGGGKHRPRRPKSPIFVDIPHAAGLAGFSVRHFRRIMEEDRIPIIQIGRKFFILGKEFDRWMASSKGSFKPSWHREVGLEGSPVELTQFVAPVAELSEKEKILAVLSEAKSLPEAVSQLGLGSVPELMVKCRANNLSAELQQFLSRIK